MHRDAQSGRRHETQHCWGTYDRRAFVIHAGNEVAISARASSSMHSHRASAGLFVGEPSSRLTAKHSTLTSDRAWRGGALMSRHRRPYDQLPSAGIYLCFQCFLIHDLRAAVAVAFDRRRGIDDQTFAFAHAMKRPPDLGPTSASFMTTAARPHRSQTDTRRTLHRFRPRIECCLPSAPRSVARGCSATFW